MMLFSLWVVCLLFLSWVALSTYISIAKRHAILDTPNNRSMHTIATLRGGGIIFPFCLVASTLFLTISLKLQLSSPLIMLTIASCLLAVLGFIDDIINLSSLLRVSIQLLIAIGFLISVDGWHTLHIAGVLLSAPILLSILGVVFIIWSVNLFNFMDGSDGLAASEACFIFIFGAIAFYTHHNLLLAKLCVCLLIPLLVFLKCNWPPAKLFMGDVGSTMLGASIGFLAIISQKNNVPILSWLIIYMFFLGDSTMTLIRRLMFGENIFKAHRSHAYQRLIQSTNKHSSALIASFIINSACFILAICSLHRPKEDILYFLAALSLFLCYYAWVEKMTPMCKLNAKKTH